VIVVNVVQAISETHGTMPRFLCSMLVQASNFVKPIK